MSGNSVFLARLIGPVMIAVAIGIFVNGTAYRALAEEFVRSRALIYLSGLLLMTAGLAIVLTHNRWVLGWAVLITILGWLATVGGAAQIVCPQGAERVGGRMLRHPRAIQIGAAVWLIIGVILCFFGYIR